MSIEFSAWCLSAQQAHAAVTGVHIRKFYIILHVNWRTPARDLARISPIGMHVKGTSKVQLGKLLGCIQT